MGMLGGSGQVWVIFGCKDDVHKATLRGHACIGADKQVRLGCETPGRPASLFGSVFPFARSSHVLQDRSVSSDGLYVDDREYLP